MLTLSAICLMFSYLAGFEYISALRESRAAVWGDAGRHSSEVSVSDSFIISILIKPQQSISNSYGHCGVICKLRFFAEEREILALIASVKFIRRTNHVS